VARVVAPVSLVDLVGVAARRFGLTQQIGTSTDYATTQAWARSLYDGYGELEGLRWRGRQAGSICLVLTDRARMRCLRREDDFAVADPSVWPRIARAAQRCAVRIV
jgi:hypothetical protein